MFVASTGIYGDSCSFLYVDVFRTLQETPMGLYSLLRGGDSFTFLYVDGVRRSEQTCVLVCTDCSAEHTQSQWPGAHSDADVHDQSCCEGRRGVLFRMEL
jgi:hypothetical protein